MILSNKTFKSLEELKEHLSGHGPTMFLGSKTSTVIPFDNIQKWLEKNCPNMAQMTFGDLSTLPKKLELDSNGNMVVTGPVTWQEAKAEVQTMGRLVMTSPTEELASILSGVATSATGERCFGYGTLRSQVEEIEYLDWNGESRVLKDLPYSESEIFNEEEKRILSKYMDSYSYYSNFKNAPFPRFESELDLMTGTEGQLGVITKAVIRTTPMEESTYIFLLLPKWEETTQPHLEVFELVQNFREDIRACELLDSNSLDVLDDEMCPKRGADLIFLELPTDKFEKVYESFLSKLKLVSSENIFEMSAPKCRELRMAVPRATFEDNAKAGVIKMGTDVQVKPGQFKKMLEYYRTWTNEGLRYNLFGHFGDAHLHFNFLPTANDLDKCQGHLDNLYEWVKENQGSPFAEHGIGLLKKKYIQHFYQDIHIETFKMLKNKFDPKNQFFPLGFMS